ncbi:MAG: tetratricopeptide repeat-containing diguanylate cyclase [Acidobacteriota bacterium]
MRSRSRATRRGLGFALLCCILTGPAATASSDDLERLAELRRHDVAAALELAEALWAAEPSNAAVGHALVVTLAAAGEASRAMELADEIVSRPETEPAQRARLLEAKLDAAKPEKRYASLPADEALLADLVPELEPLVAARLLEKIGVAYYIDGNFPTSSRFLERAIAHRPQVVDSWQRGFFTNLGAMYAQQARYPEAIEAMQSGLRISEELGEEPSLGLLRNLGGLHLTIGNYEESIAFTQRALSVTPEGGAVAASLMNNLGASLQSLQRFDEAKASYRKSIGVYEKLGKEDAGVLNNLAFLLHEEGSHRESLALLDRVVELNEETQDRELVAVARKNQAENWIALGDRRRAAEMMEQAHALFLEYDLRPKRLELYPVMIDNAAALGRYRRAFELLREYKDLYDETVSVESAEKVAELQSRFDLEKTQRELATAQRNQAVSEAQVEALQYGRQVQRDILTIVLVGLALLSIIAFLFFRAWHFRGRANRELESKNLEIAAQAEALQELNEELLRQGREDQLTGLYNRHFLQDFLDKEVPRLERQSEAGAPESSLLIVADLDHFKQINDRYGHATGDEALRAFAKALQACARTSDYCVRWGGEEFLWLCRDADADDAAALCDRLLAAASDVEIALPEGSVTLTCSIGYAPFPLAPEGPIDWALTLGAADAALYEAKRTGRNRWRGVQPCDGAVVAPAQQVQALLEQGALEFAAQVAH